MANVKFSDFAGATAIQDVDTFVGLQGGENVEYAFSQLKSFITPFKKYAATLNSSGLVVNELQNDFEGVTYTYTNPTNGVLNIVPSEGIFTSGKTVFVSGCLNSGGVPYFVMGRNSGDSLLIISIIKYDGTNTGTPSFSELSIQFLVYD